MIWAAAHFGLPMPPKDVVAAAITQPDLFDFDAIRAAAKAAAAGGGE